MKRDPLPSTEALPASGQASSSGWRPALCSLAVALFAVLACFNPTATAIVRTWANSETYAHGFAVIPIALWLVWRIRARIRAIVPDPSPRALPLIALAGLIWLVGDFGAVNALSQAAFVAILALTVVAVLGVTVARAILFPLGFLFFAVPIGNFLLPTLMERTADFTVSALRFSGVPVYREGFLMVLPNGAWSIVEACSGVRYLIASLMVGTLFAYLNYTAQWRRWVFVGVSIAVPIVANWVRAYLIVMLGYLSNNKLAVGVDHLIYGWLFFGVVMLLMFWIGARWREPAPVVKPADALSVDILPGREGPVRNHSFAAIAIAVAIVAATWPAIESAESRQDDRGINLAGIEVPAWDHVDSGEGVWAPRFENPSATFGESLRNGDTVGGVFIGFYRNQNSRSKVATSQNQVGASEDSGWTRTVLSRAHVSLDGVPTTVSTARLRRADGTVVLAWQWYWINGVVTSSDAVAKARIAWLRITGQHDDSASIIVYVVNGDSQTSSTKLAALANSAWPGIRSQLTHASGGR